MTSNKPFVASAGDFAKNLAAAVAVLVTLGGVLVGLSSFIDSRIERHLANPETLKVIAIQVRPAIVFDSKNRILADQGGLQHIHELPVIPGDGTIPSEIIVKPRNFLPVAPLLESLDELGLNVETERGQGIEWRLKLSAGGILESGAVNPRFRLEILQ